MCFVEVEKNKNERNDLEKNGKKFSIPIPLTLRHGRHFQGSARCQRGREEAVGGCGMERV